MKWTRLAWILTAWVSITLNAQTSNEIAEPKSRSRIVERPPLRGKAPSPPEVPSTPNQPATNVKLTGFTTLGTKRAFFVLVDEKTKASQSISLAIDEEVAGLKLIEIDPVSRSVHVVQDGAEKALTFERDGVASSIVIAAPTATSTNSVVQPGSPRSGSPRNSALTSPPNRTRGTNAPAIGNRSSPSRPDPAESQNPRDRRSPPRNGPTRR